MRDEFLHRLRDLEDMVQEAGHAIEESLTGAVGLLHAWDDDVEQRITARDELVTERYREIERNVEQLFALRAPVAGDLRLLLALIHIDQHLSRMSRNCVRIARFAERIIGEIPDEALLDRFERMGVRAQHMMRTAFTALEQRDAESALELAKLDQAIDADNLWITDHALSLGFDPSRRMWAMHVIFVARSLERMGDHAVAIGGQVNYIVTGNRPELTGAPAETA